MLFEKQDDEPEKIRRPDPNFHAGFKWVTIYKGDQIELAEDHGLRLGLVPIKKKELVPNKPIVPKDTVPKVTEKKNLVELFQKELESIKGIGKKTSQDIIRIYHTQINLQKALTSGFDVPIRDDLAKLLKKKFGVK